jgi:AraC family transcriptional regulator of adaptative response / methylphosphotriester-DNA alkyltransferase methyltransferase
VLNTVSSVVQLLNTVQQAAAGLQKSGAVSHTFNGSTPRKQADINAPGLGVVWDNPRVASRKTDRRRKRLQADAERAIRERYAEFDLGLVDIAEDVGCSTRQLQRVFQELGGTDFRSYLLRVRMENAHRLLSRKKDGLTVRAAARSVGYREASGLRQRFKNFYGYNPSEIQNTEIDAEYDRAWREAEASR